jgi:beta-lactamase superfamily II metal-dependent hydrolase
MTGLAYLASIIAVVWLSYWLLQNSQSHRNNRGQPKQNPKRGIILQWTPFDYDVLEKSDQNSAEQNQTKGWRSRATSTRRRG